MNQGTRYQGAVIRGDNILLIKHSEPATGRSYWVIPGGRREADEAEEACVRRELLEETTLQVSVERLLLDEEGVSGGVYRHLKTYLCRVDSGDAQPGFEPEIDASHYSITEVRWFDLRDPAGWDAQVKTDPFTYSLLQKIQAALGYPVAG
jgi:8-oxo-dGTP pyrophosphatase MutT (NUDIX family)